MKYGNDCDGDAMGDNAGKGNRAVASHIKNIHAASKNSGSVSSMAKPSMTMKQPGAPMSSLKMPRRSHSKSSGLMD